MRYTMDIKRLYCLHEDGHTQFQISPLQVFYGVDFGGTNLRAVRVELDGKGSSSTTQCRCNIRNDEAAAHLTKGLLDKEATASMLFDAIAKQIKILMTENVSCTRLYVASFYISLHHMSVFVCLSLLLGSVCYVCIPFASVVG